MPTNYNFKENWYEVIVPLLNTPKVAINEETNILYTSCINYVRGSLFTELSPKYKTMFDNMNGNLKFNYIGTGTNLKNLFNSYSLEYEE
tara:strand:- start:81 stop:347 length:267 start_codon:yes stop_codon:yes gene_type:complete